MSQLLFEEETFAIRCAVFEVYREMGSGFLEQVLNYLKTTNLKLGLLVNFGSHPKVQIERLIL